VTLGKPSQHTAGALAGGPSLCDMETIFIGIDKVGEFAYHLRDGEELPAGNVRWRFVAETDDFAEAVGIMALTSRRIRASHRSRSGTLEAGA